MKSQHYEIEHVKRCLDRVRKTRVELERVYRDMVAMDIRTESDLLRLSDLYHEAELVLSNLDQALWD